MLDLVAAPEGVAQARLLEEAQPQAGEQAFHDSALYRIAESGEEWLASTWVVTLAPRTATRLLGAAARRGAIVERVRRVGGVWPRRTYDVVDEAHAARLRTELRRVHEGTSTDAMATAVFLLCAAAALPKLVPGRPPLKGLRRRAAQLPRSAVADGLGEAAAALAAPLAGDGSGMLCLDAAVGDFGGCDFG